MSWANVYVGIPFVDLGRGIDGCDCWGLARLVYRDLLKIELPSCASEYSSSAERSEVTALLEARAHAPWSEVFEDIAPFDLLLFRRGRADSHIGIAVSDRHMLHMASGDHAKIENPAAPRWRSRFIGSYRHADCPVNTSLGAVK